MEFCFTCPKCGKILTKKGNSLFCDDGHCYDLSKSGYANLILANQKNSADAGDNPEMIKARVEVMDSGYYSVLADDIISVFERFSPRIVLDAGCGVGYIPFRLKNAFPDASVIATDISKSAVMTASKKYKDINFAVASSMRLPLENGVVDGIVCAFAPVFREEMLRVLKTGGVFIRVTPDEKHLFKLKTLLYDNPRENERDPDEMEGFELLKKVTSKSMLKAGGGLLYSIIKMTPYYYHSKKEDIEKLLKIESAEINLEFLLQIYRKI